MRCLRLRRFPGGLWRCQSLRKALSCTYIAIVGDIDGLKAKTDCQLADSDACGIWLYVSTAAHTINGGSLFLMRGFAAEPAVEQESSVEGSLRGRPQRKVCTGCKLDKPASEFRASRTSRDGLQHFCIPCKVIEAEAVGMAAPLTRVTATEAVCRRCKQLKPAADFYRKSSSKTGLQSWCKACTEESAKQWRERVLELPPDRSADIGYKVCARCHTAKRPEEFTRHNSTLDGLSSHCRQCKEKVRQLSLQRMPGALAPSETRVCTKCGREVKSSNFYAKPDSTTGLHSWCKDCQKGCNAGFVSTPARQGGREISLVRSSDTA
ncbi:hypothetical protein COCOBI_04-7820 [Coccomyxa sp. Obi]|nr:hypothetical protein COCOBI_04-7820 [Coccomyxa sp. Obi]